MDYSKEEVIEALLNRVKNNEHSSFAFIRSMQERAAAKEYYNVAVKTAEHFNILKQAILRGYCKDILTDKTDIEGLVAVRHLDEAVKFYYNEANIALDALKEYKAYLFGGHLFGSIVLNNYRPDEDCIDYRKLPWRFF